MRLNWQKKSQFDFVLMMNLRFALILPCLLLSFLSLFITSFLSSSTCSFPPSYISSISVLSSSSPPSKNLSLPAVFFLKSAFAKDTQRAHTHLSRCVCVCVCVDVRKTVSVPVCVCYLDHRQPHVLGGGEAVQQQQRRRGAPWRPPAGITETVTSAVRVADHQPQPATPVPEEDQSRITAS